MRPVGKRLLVTGIALVGLLGTLAAASLGPSTQVVCGQGSLLDRLAQRITQPLGAGQIDGPTASYCVVPSATAWLMAAAILVASAALAVSVGIRARSR